MDSVIAESARSRARELHTNRPTAPPSTRPSGITDIKTTLRTQWGQIASRGVTRADLLAGLTVATVAIPLNVALALAAGLPASAGLVSGAIGGAVAAAFGGSNYQVSGPAAALNVMVFALVQQYGVGAAAAAALVCGVVTIAIALLGYGKLANYLPKLVLAGFTTGVGLKLLDQQIPILLGSDRALRHIAGDFWAMEWLREVNWLSVVCGILVAWVTVGLAHLKSFPSALLGIAIATAVSYELDWSIARVGEVDLELAFGLPVITEGTTWSGLIAAAIPLAFLSAAESLISAKAVDDMSGGKSGYNSNAELFGQGVGNLASGMFGGMSLAGVIVRSSVNQQAGAVSRLAAMFHGVFLAIAAYFFGHSLSVIPIAALAGLLVVIAWRLIKVKLLVDAIRTKKLHALAFVAAAVGTVMGHLMTGLAVGCLLVYAEHYIKSRIAKKHEQHEPSARAAPSIRSVAQWHRHVRTRPKVHPTAFVHPTASVIGWVELGREVNVAADTSVRADEGAPFYIGDRSNVQDGVVIHALKDRYVTVDGREWAVHIGHDVSLAHQALVHGPSRIGDNSFVGFKAIVHDAIIGEGCFIGLGALVVGVTIPARKRVPNGWVVDSAAKVAELPDVEHAQSHFNEDVVEVNRGLAIAYARNETEHKHVDPAIANGVAVRSRLSPIKQF